MLLLRPGIGEINLDPRQAGIGNAVVEHVEGVGQVDAQVGEPQCGRAMGQTAGARRMYLDADEIDTWVGGGHRQQGIAHAKADFQHHRGNAPEHL